MELTFQRPYDIEKLSKDDRAAKANENEDLCVLEGKRFFIRALLPLPVNPREHPYYIGLWVEVSQASFERISELRDAETQVDEPPFPAQVANEIPGISGVLGLLAELHLTGPVTRPKVRLKASANRLYLEHIHGIDTYRAAEYSALARSC